MSAPIQPRVPRSPFRKLPEDRIRDIVLYLNMKERARFGATCKRHHEIDLRAGFRKFETIKIGFDANTCTVYCQFDSPLKLLVLDSIRLFEGDRWADRAFLFIKNSTVGVFGIHIYRVNERIIDTINSMFSNMLCNHYWLHILTPLQNDRVLFPDLSMIMNRENASFLFKISAFSTHVPRIKHFLSNLPTIKSFSFEPENWKSTENCEDFVAICDNSTVSRIVEECQHLNISHTPLSGDRLHALMQLIDKHPENTVSMWDCPNDYEAVCSLRVQPGFRRSLNGEYHVLVHDPSSTIVIYQQGSIRVLIANVPQNKVNDANFVSKLWERTLPNHRK